MFTNLCAYHLLLSSKHIVNRLSIDSLPMHWEVLDDQFPDGETFPRIVIHELRHSHAVYVR